MKEEDIFQLLLMHHLSLVATNDQFNVFLVDAGIFADGFGGDLDFIPVFNRCHEFPRA